MNLEKNLDYYIENQNELVQKYNGKYGVFYDAKFIQAFPVDIEALKFGIAQYVGGNFTVQKISPGKESYTATYHTRVRLA
jgi:hypothetical protein